MLLKATEKHSCSFKAVIICLLVSFSLMSVVPAQALAQGVLNLPAPGTAVPLSPGFVPVMLRGLQVNLENPFQFDFIVDSGNSGLEGDALKVESEKLAKYFLATLTTPEEDLWVNLSPFEKDRIIPEDLGKTAMGQDLLAQDYILKQVTASLILPDSETGKVFWDKVYKKAYQEYGTTNIPADTFNKVWIVPETAVVYEDATRAIITESHLKVMLESDYLAEQKSREEKVESREKKKEDRGKRGEEPQAVGSREHIVSSEKPLLNTNDNIPNTVSSSPLLTSNVYPLASDISSSIVREVLIPLLEKEVNEGKSFTQLRQMFHAMVLATWYKQALKTSILNRVYADQRKIKGLEVNSEEYLVNSKNKESATIHNSPDTMHALQDTNDQILDTVHPSQIDQIYHQYLAAYKKGVCDLVRVEQDPYTHKPVARKYFSGGFGNPGGKPISSAITRKPWRSLRETAIGFVVGAMLVVSIGLQDLKAAVEEINSQPLSTEQVDEGAKTQIIQIESEEQDAFDGIMEQLRNRINELGDPSSWNRDFFSKESLHETAIAGLMIIAFAGFLGNLSFRSARRKMLKRIVEDLQAAELRSEMLLRDNSLFLSSGKVKVVINRDKIHFFNGRVKLSLNNDDRRYFVSLLWLLPFFSNKDNPNSSQMKDFIWDCFKISLALPQKFYRQDVSLPFAEQEPLLDRNTMFDFFIGKMIEHPELRPALQERFADIRPNFLYIDSGKYSETSDSLLKLVEMVSREIKEGKSDYAQDLLFLDSVSKYFYIDNRSGLILKMFLNELFPQDQDVILRFLGKLMNEYRYWYSLSDIPEIGKFAVKNKEILDDNISLIKVILSEESNIRNIIDLTSSIANRHNFTQKEFDDFLAMFFLDPEKNVPIADVLVGWYKRRSENFILPEDLKNAMQELRSGNAQTEHLLDSPLYLLANYFLLSDLMVDKAEKSMIGEKVNFSEFKELVKDFLRMSENGISRFSRIGENNLLNLRAVAYEAFLMWEQILNVKKRAKELNREVVVVANLSYGGVALAPITHQEGGKNFVKGTNIPIWRTKVGSTEAHHNEYVLPENLFSPDQLRFLVEKNPIVIVVDGSTSVADRSRTWPHIPDGFKGYRNFFIALNVALGHQIDPKEFFQDKAFVDGLQTEPSVVNTINQIQGVDFNPTKSDPYVLRFWYKRRGFLYLRQNKTRTNVARKVNIDKIESPACIIFQSAVHPKDVPVRIKKDFIGGKHIPARFDDNDAFKKFFLTYEKNYGIIPSEIFAKYSREALEGLIGLLGDPAQSSLADQNDQEFSEKSDKLQPSGASPLTVKSQEDEKGGAGSLADIVRAQQPLFSILPQEEYSRAYKIPESKKEVVRLMKKMILGGKAVTENIQRSLKAQDMMKMVNNVLRVQPSQQSVQLIKSLISLVGEEGREGEFMQVVEKLAEANPFTMFSVNTAKIDIAEQAFKALQDRGIQNIMRADTGSEMAKNLVQHGGFGVVISGLEIEGSSQYMLDLSINRRPLFHVDPLWNLARWRSASEHSDYNQHNYLMNTMKWGIPIFIASQDRFFAENGDFDPRSESLAVRTFKDKAIKRPWIDYPEPGKNISAQHVKNVERYTTDYRATENIIDGTFMMMVSPNRQKFLIDRIEKAQTGDYQAARDLPGHAFGFANNLRVRHFITQEGFYDRAISDAQQGNIAAFDFLVYIDKVYYWPVDNVEQIPNGIRQKVRTFLKTMDVEPYKDNIRNRSVQWSLDHASFLGNEKAKKFLEEQSSSAVGGINSQPSGASPIVNQQVTDREVFDLWDVTQDEFILFHGTSFQNREKIKQYGLDPQYKPFADQYVYVHDQKVNSIARYEELYQKASQAPLPFAGRHESGLIHLTTRYENARIYAQAGSEVINMMLDRIPGLLGSDKLDNEEKKQLKEIQDQFLPYAEEHLAYLQNSGPYVLAVKGSALQRSGLAVFENKESFLKEFRRFENAAIEDGMDPSLEHFKKLLLLNKNDIKVANVYPEEIQFPEEAQEKGTTSEGMASKKVGGIDFNAANLELKRAGSSPIQFSLPAEWQGVDLENVSGFVPVIVNIVPIYNLQGFLGMGEDQTQQDFALSKG